VFKTKIGLQKCVLNFIVETEKQTYSLIIIIREILSPTITQPYRYVKSFNTKT